VPIAPNEIDDFLRLKRREAKRIEPLRERFAARLHRDEVLRMVAICLQHDDPADEGMLGLVGLTDTRVFFEGQDETFRQVPRDHLIATRLALDNGIVFEASEGNSLRVTRLRPDWAAGPFSEWVWRWNGKRPEARLDLESVTAASTPRQPPTQTDAERLDQLKKLGELRDARVLSDAEFQTEKARLLGSD
jgi:hypothetical protein